MLKWYVSVSRGVWMLSVDEGGVDEGVTLGTMISRGWQGKGLVG